MGIKNLRVMVDALQLFALRDALTVKDLSLALKMPRSSSHRLAASLLAMRFIEKVDANGAYALGPLVGELAGGTFTWRVLVAQSRPEMEALRDSSGETVALHVMQAERRVLLDQVESAQELRWVFSNPLVPMPLHAGAAAKMLLALLPDADVHRIVKRDDLVAYTDRTPRSLAGLMRELQQIRAQGYSASLEEVSPGIVSLAVPVVRTPFAGQPLAVMNLTGPAVRLPEKRLKSLLPSLQKAARRATARLEHALGKNRQAA